MTLPVLDTTRLLLRPLKETDVSAIYSLRSNEQVNQFIDRPTAKDPTEDSIKFHERFRFI